MIKKFLFLLFFVILICTGCSYHQVISKSKYISNYLNMTIYYYDSSEDEYIVNSMNWLNEYLSNYHEKAFIGGSIFINFYRNLSLNENRLLGLTTPIDYGMMSIDLIQYNTFVARFNIKKHFTDYKNIKINKKLIDTLYQAYIIHELTHCFLFQIDIADTGKHEYFAYAIETQFIVDNIDNIQSKLISKLFKDEYLENPIFINEELYNEDLEEYRKLSYTHFLKTNGQLLKDYLSQF